MVSAASVVVPLLLLLLAAACSYYGLRVYGWPTMYTTLQAAPYRLRRWALSSLRFVVEWVLKRLGRDSFMLFGRRRDNPSSLAQVRFLKYSDPVHRFSFVYPAAWNLLRTENSAAAIIVQVTCDSAEESYKRFSVAWDDVSWSATSAESFGRNIAQQLPSLVPGSTLVSSGPYDAAIRGDGAFQLVYRIADAMDGSELQLLNVVIVAQHGACRRAYTLTFGTDADAFDDVSWLAKHMVESFHFDDPGAALVPSAMGRRRIGSSRLSADLMGHRTSSADLQSQSTDEATHINVWERERSGTEGSSSKGSGAPEAGGAAAAGAFGLGVADTPTDPAAVTWAHASLPCAGLAFQHPSSWVSTGNGSEDAVGFAELAMHSVRRWCASFTCDRRESAYKHMSIICVDLSSCAELVAARAGGRLAAAAAGSSSAAAAANGHSAQTAAAQAHSVLLQYLVWRYRREVLEAGGSQGAGTSSPSITSPAPSSPSAFQPGDDILQPWLETFASRWPQSCQLSSAAAAGPSRGGGAFGLSSSQPHSPWQSQGPAASSAAASSGATIAAAVAAASSAPAAQPVLPHWTNILDSRVVASSRLLKVGGWAKTASSGTGAAASSFLPVSFATPGGGASTPGSIYRTASPSHARNSVDSYSTPVRHYSTYSAHSLENETVLAEGLFVPIVSAVLIGVYDAMVVRGGAAAAGEAGKGAPSSSGSSAAAVAPQKRTFGHIVTFATTSDVFQRYEPLAKHLFQSLEVVTATSAV